MSRVCDGSGYKRLPGNVKLFTDLMGGGGGGERLLTVFKIYLALAIPDVRYLYAFRRCLVLESEE